MGSNLRPVDGSNFAISSLTTGGDVTQAPTREPITATAATFSERLTQLIQALTEDANTVADHMAHGGAERLDERNVQGDVPRFALSPDLIGLARACAKGNEYRDPKAGKELSEWQGLLRNSPHYPTVNFAMDEFGRQNGSVRYPQGTVTMGPTLGTDGLPIPGERISFTTITPLKLVRFAESPRPDFWQHPGTGHFWALGLETVDTIGRNPRLVSVAAGQELTDDQLSQNIQSTFNTSSAYVVFYNASAAVSRTRS